MASDLDKKLEPPEKTKKSGLFIVFEGQDGSGQSTQVRMLNEYLAKNGYDVLPTKEPTTGPIGKIIRSALQHELSFGAHALQLLFCADRAYHLDDCIEPALKEGKVVITDRYYLSTLAFGMASGADYDLLHKINMKFRTPDVVFLIDVNPSVAVERIGKRGEKYELFEVEQTLSKVRKAYLEVAKAFNTVVVNGESSSEEVHKRIVAALQPYLDALKE